MKRTSQEIYEEKKRVCDYMHSAPDLSIENTNIVWKTGIFVGLLFIALFIASYYVSNNIIAWLMYLMPIGAYLIARKYRVRKTFTDMQFHMVWKYIWGVAVVGAFVPHFYKDLSVYGIFLVYYVIITFGLLILYELMRVQYASAVMCGACGIAIMGIQVAIDPETTIRWCLGTFFLFDVITILLSGLVMKWQVKNHVANPINFPKQKD